MHSIHTVLNRRVAPRPDPQADWGSQFRRQAGQHAVNHLTRQARREAHHGEGQPRRLQVQFQGDSNGTALDAPVPEPVFGVFRGGPVEVVAHSRLRGRLVVLDGQGVVQTAIENAPVGRTLGV